MPTPRGPTPTPAFVLWPRAYIVRTYKPIVPWLGIARQGPRLTNRHIVHRDRLRSQRRGSLSVSPHHQTCCSQRAPRYQYRWRASLLGYQLCTSVVRQLERRLVKNAKSRSDLPPSFPGSPLRHNSRPTPSRDHLWELLIKSGRYLQMNFVLSPTLDVLLTDPLGVMLARRHHEDSLVDRVNRDGSAYCPLLQSSSGWRGDGG